MMPKYDLYSTKQLPRKVSCVQSAGNKKNPFLSSPFEKTFSGLDWFS